MVRGLVGAFGTALLAVMLADAVQTVVVARRAQGLPRLTQWLFQLTWQPLAAIARQIKSPTRRENVLCVYGPLSLLLLLTWWAAGMIFGFALVQWAADLHLNRTAADLGDSIYFSAGTFFTLGVAEPVGRLSKYLMVLEAGFGFSFLGLVIGYLPVLYQSYSSRELRISLLDARAGSPPSAAEFLRRHGRNPDTLEQRLAGWEAWAMELLESHLSYPMLAYYRSQHANQSWLAALTAIVDASAVVALTADEDLKRQAEFTFAAGRHALAHLAAILRAAARRRRKERLTEEDFARLRDTISGGRTPLQADRLAQADLAKLRALYEPCAAALARYLLMPLPPWTPSADVYENWRRSSWEHIDAPIVAPHPFSRQRGGAS